MSDEQRRDPRLDAFDALVGEWVLGDPAAPVGRTAFAWLEGGYFLIQRWTVDFAGAPDGIAVYGLDRHSGQLVQHFYDSRGVARVYETSLRDGVWRLSRTVADHSTDFSQRFTGRLGADGRTIIGAWEMSVDGATWEHDFDLVYTNVDPR